VPTSGPVERGQDAEYTNVVGHGLWWFRALAAIRWIYKPTGEPLSVALGRTRIADIQSDIQAIGGSADTSIKVKDYEASSYYWPALSAIIVN